MPLENRRKKRTPPCPDIWMVDVCPSRIEDMALKGPYLMEEKKKRHA